MIINGKEIADQKLSLLKEKVEFLKSKNIEPSLGIIIIGSNPASEIYVRNKASDAKKIGIKSQIFALDSDVSEDELIGFIDALNEDISVHGIIIQLPIPNHLNKRKVLNFISPEKDVDGFHSYNVGLLYSGEDSGLTSCTPLGCLEIIKSKITNLSGLHAVIVGRSEIVGKPMASLLLRENCTVTITHSKTQNLKEITKLADIVITAIGIPKFFDKSYFNENAFLIDVGINRVEVDGIMKLVGDIDFEDVYDYVKYITPVPGGVGPMTRACLLENTIHACIKLT